MYSKLVMKDVVIISFWGVFLVYFEHVSWELKVSLISLDPVSISRLIFGIF